MYRYFNNNPTARRVGDCAVRAVSVALGIDWEEAYNMIADAGYAMGDMPSSNSVWGSVLRSNGFYRSAIPTTCPDCYTTEEFIRDHPRGIYVLCSGGSEGHVATVRDGILFDTWDSSQECPQFYWYRKE